MPSVSLDKIIVFDAKSKELFDNNELYFSQNGDSIQVTINVKEFKQILSKTKTKRKLSAWNKFVKANSNKKKFQYASGKLKLKKMGIAYRKTKR